MKEGMVWRHGHTIYKRTRQQKRLLFSSLSLSTMRSVSPTPLSWCENIITRQDPGAWAHNFLHARGHESLSVLLEDERTLRASVNYQREFVFSVFLLTVHLYSCSFFCILSIIPPFPQSACRVANRAKAWLSSLPFPFVSLSLSLFWRVRVCTPNLLSRRVHTT